LLLIFASRAIKSAWWNSVNGCAAMSSKPCPNFTSCSKHRDALPGAVIAIQTFGDLLGYNPHLHVLISDGCFHESGLLTVAPRIDTHALERLDYDAPSATVVYKSKDGRRQKCFDALEWLAAMSSHVPNKGEQMVRYYGYYSNPARLAVSRGKRQKTGEDCVVAYVLEPPMPDKAFRKNWARLIQKIAACPGHDPGRSILWCARRAVRRCG
jgi:hypothetical protein